MPRWVENAPRLMRWGYVETSARVRWGECDVQGHAYYGSYIPWCDLGREAFALAAGLQYGDFMITTTEFHMRFHTSAKYLDDLVIRTWATTPKARLDCYYEIYRREGGQLIMEARSGHALVDDKLGLRMQPPDDFRDRVESFLDRQRVANRSPGRALAVTEPG